MHADKIFYNGTIITVDKNFSIAEAVAVKAGKIIAVGKNAFVKNLTGAETTCIDLEGRAMLPGFIDAHGHFGKAIKSAAWVKTMSSDFYNPTCISVNQVVETLKEYQQKKSSGKPRFIVGYGCNEDRLQEKRFLNKFDLDRVSTTQPVMVASISFHTFSFNSKGLELLKVDANSKDTDVNRIRRIEGSSEPDGVIQGPLAQDFFFNLSITDLTEQLEAFEKAQLQFFSAGITTVQEGKSTPDDINLLVAIAKTGHIAIDIVSFVDYTAIDEVLANHSLQIGQNRDHLCLCGIKLISDGALSSNAYLSRPYEGTDDFGQQYISAELMEKVIREALRHKWQICVHAMGDAAIDKLLDIYEKVTREEGLDLTAQRNIINHASAVRLDQLPRIKKSGLLVSFYPAAGSQWYERYIHRLGEERAALTNPMRSAIEQGIVVTAHNDAPIIDPDPFIILWSAVNRRSVYTDTLWGPQERISVKEALRTVTINAAIQYRQENIKGSIEPGKQADLIILSHNPLAIDPIELKDVKVLETIKDGQSVYNA